MSGDQVAGGIERSGAGGRLAEFSLAWTAYLAPCALLVLGAALTVGVAAVSSAAGAIVMTCLFAWFVYLTLYRNSVVLFIDVDGVWVFSGLLPWSKGTSGVLWSDMDLASFRPGFLSWALKSYRVSINNRFTNRRELDIAHVRAGDSAVKLINLMRSERSSSAGGLPSAGR